MDVIPCPLHEGSSGHCPQQNTWVLQLRRMPAPSCSSIPPSYGGLRLLGMPVLGFAAGLLDIAPLLWGGSAPQLCLWHPPRDGWAAAALAQKRWKIKEPGRGNCWVLIVGTAEAGKGLKGQTKLVSIMYKLVH